MLVDITPHKDTEAKLSKLESRFADLVERSPDIIFSLDSTGRFTFVNSQIERLLGRHVRETLHTPLWDYVVPEHRPRAKTVLDSAAETVWDQEMNLVSSSGERKYVRVRCRPSFDDSGMPAGFIGSIRDRTRQRMLEEELEAYRHSLSESEALYRRLVDEIPDVMFTLDREAKFTFLNCLVEQLLGYRVEEILETPLWDHVSPESRSLSKTLLDTTPGAIWDKKLYLLDAQRRKKFVRIRCRAGAQADGTIGIFEGTIRDRTQERELEEALEGYQESLKKSEKKYRNLVERAPDIIFALDTEGRFTFLNPEAERFLLYPYRKCSELPCGITFYQGSAARRRRSLTSITRESGISS